MKEAVPVLSLFITHFNCIGIMTKHDSTPSVIPTVSSCCDWSVLRGRLSWVLWLGVTVPSVAAALFFAGMSWNSTSLPPQNDLARWENLPIADAVGAVRDDDYSIATGLIADLTEGLFVLDHNSGLLQCSIMYPRISRFMAQFTVNVADALGGAVKGGKYLMVTGTADFPRSNQMPAASSVVYVMDTATGNFACYGIPFNRAEMNANRVQQGPLVLIATGSANPVIDRDDLR